ncbi:MAG: SPOR domain-containing protein [Bacteroidetes bacterium]|nr:SPOR domain-containing protein [Bacteroidota bacterium]
MKKQQLYSIALFLLVSTLLFAQHPGTRWAELHSGDEKTVYMDTTSIRLLDNQLSVWCLVQNTVPIEKEGIEGKVSKTKTQYLINTLTERYSLIGALFYDNRGRIIGESSSSRFSGGTKNLSTPVSENDLVGMLMEAAKNYAEHGYLDFNKSEFDLTEEYNDTMPQDEVEDYSAKLDDIASNINEGDESDITFEENKDDTPEYKEEEKSEDSNKYIPSSGSQSYNNSRESNAGGTVFTDGNLFCFQLSSWRNKATAEREAARLIRQGHKAFVVEAYIPQKGGNWYRVRIGYFNSFQEARNYQRTVRR